MVTLFKPVLRARPVRHAAALAVTLSLLGAPGSLAAQQTFNACYVPRVGAIYLINLPGLPTACLSPTHLEISWTEGSGVADGSVTAVKLADGAVITIKIADGAVTEPKLGFDPATQTELDALQNPGTINATGNPVDWTQLKGVPAGFADGVDNSGGTPADLACTGCVGTTDLADGAVTTAKLANAAVTEGKLGFDPATQAELDSHKASADHDGRYFTQTELSGAGTINDAGNPVDWSRLKGVPPDFADGVDNSGGTPSDLVCTGCVGTTDLADAAVTTAKIVDAAVTTTKLSFDPATQTELDALQAPGTINTLSNPVDWSQLKSVPAGFADGVDDTGGASNDVVCTGCVETTDLADAAVTTAKIADAAVTTAKLAGDAVTSVKIADGTITGVDIANGTVTGANIEDGTVQSADIADGTILTIDLGDMACADGEVLVWNDAGSAWECGVSGSGVTSITAGEGLTGGTITTTGTLSVAFAGPGSATTVARSDHTHALPPGNTNTAVGAAALGANNSGGSNSAVGGNALAANNSGSSNTAVGRNALSTNVSNSSNTAVGSGALQNANGGDFNIAVGRDAGINVTNGGNNIEIGNAGVSTDNGVIRIGDGQTATYVAGISGTSVSGVNVMVGADGQLGVLSSSARAKEAIQDLGDVSRRLFELRPVQFRYKAEYDDGSRSIQYGLIGEEVEQVFPELVVHGEDGQVQTVRYHLLPVLLLNELKRQEAELSALRQEVAAQAAALAELRAALEP